MAFSYVLFLLLFPFHPPSPPALLQHIKFEILMIYWERKRGRGREGAREGWWQGGLNMMQTIWRREPRLPAQPALFKLERKWPYIQHASKLPLPRCLSLARPFFFFLSFSQLSHSHRVWLSGARARTRKPPLISTKVKRWPLVGRVCLLFQYYVSLHHRHRAHHRYYHYDYYYNLDGRGLHGRVRIKERRGEKRAKKERQRNEGWSRKGRRRGQRFPSTAIHDLISLGSGSAETFPGMRIRSPRRRRRRKMESGSVGEVSGTSREQRRRCGPYFTQSLLEVFQRKAVKHSPRQFSS